MHRTQSRERSTAGPSYGWVSGCTGEEQKGETCSRSFELESKTNERVGRTGMAANGGCCRCC